jgi:hypothetical protein
MLSLATGERLFSTDLRGKTLSRKRRFYRWLKRLVVPNIEQTFYANWRDRVVPAHFLAANDWGHPLRCAKYRPLS